MLRALRRTSAGLWVRVPRLRADAACEGLDAARFDAALAWLDAQGTRLCVVGDVVYPA